MIAAAGLGIGWSARPGLVLRLRRDHVLPFIARSLRSSHVAARSNGIPPSRRKSAESSEPTGSLATYRSWRSEHEDAGQKITRITVSGGIARSQLMCEIFGDCAGSEAGTIQSNEGPALAPP